MKTIILGLPKAEEGLVYHIEKEIEKYDYLVVSLAFDINEFKYKNLKDRLVNTYRKTVLGDIAYKRLLKFKPFQKELEQKLAKVDHADFALIIGTDIYPEFFIQKIRQKVKKMYCYQWDGLDVYPIAKTHIKYYNKFYVFDPKDIQYKKQFPQIEALPNFYFEKITEDIKKNEDPRILQNAYYLGSFAKKRYQDLVDINEALSGADLSKRIQLYVSPSKADKLQLHPDFEIINKAVTYRENLVNIFQSDAVIDLLNPHHNGLSFRPFEAIAFNKKLITTNTEITKYDFYRPENIFVWGKDQDLAGFMRTPTEPLPQDLCEKYAFRNWLKNVLEEESGVKIKLPI